MSFEIRGVHLVEETERCYLIEVELGDATSFDWDSVAQESNDTAQSNWQAVWDEQPIGENRWVFFFHHLDLDRPITTSFGETPLPEPTPLPARLSGIKYESPC